MSLTDSNILLDLGYRARLPPISIEHSSRVRSLPLTSGNVISPVANGKSNMVQPGSFDRPKVSFGDPCVPVVHEFGLCSFEILKPKVWIMSPLTEREWGATYWQNVHSSTTSVLFVSSNKLGVIHGWEDTDQPKIRNKCNRLNR